MMKYKPNEEQEFAHYLDNQKRLKDNIGKLPDSTKRFYKNIAKNTQKQATENDVYSLFFMRPKNAEVAFMAGGLSQNPDLTKIENKIEARRNFELFIPQFLEIFHNFGFNAVIQNRANGEGLSNFNPEGQDPEDNESWKNS